MKCYILKESIIVLLIIFQATAISNTFAQKGFLIESVNLQIYRDGLVNEWNRYYGSGFFDRRSN